MEWVILYIVCVMIGGGLIGACHAMSKDDLEKGDIGSILFLILVVPPVAIAVGMMILSKKLTSKTKRSKQ